MRRRIMLIAIDLNCSAPDVIRRAISEFLERFEADVPLKPKNR